MREDNIFERTAVVSGDSFIGRERFLQGMIREINRGCPVHLAYCGLNRIGKSSLLERVYRYAVSRGPEFFYHIVIRTQMYLFENATDFWAHFVRSLENALISKGLMTRDLKEVFGDYAVDRSSVALQAITNQLRAEGINVLFLLDEFDKAIDVFKDQLRDFNLLREINIMPSEGEGGLSTLIFSRHKLEKIAHLVHNSSTFHTSFNQIPIPGFDDEDMAAYFRVYERAYCMTLSETQKNDIVHYCGRIPFLLSNVGHYFVERLLSGEDPNGIRIADIVMNEFHLTYTDFHNQIIRLLREDGLLDTLVSEVLGPNIGLNGTAVQTLKNLGYIDGKYAISEYFTNILAHVEVENGQWDKLLALEKKIKDVVRSELPRLLVRMPGEDDGGAFCRLPILLDSGQNGLIDKRRYDKWINDMRIAWDVNVAYLDVLSLPDLRLLIRHPQNWTFFREHFHGLNYASCDQKLGRCAKARGAHAHGNGNLLSGLQIAEVDQCCDDILNALR